MKLFLLFAGVLFLFQGCGLSDTCGPFPDLPTKDFSDSVKAVAKFDTIHLKLYEPLHPSSTYEIRTSPRLIDSILISVAIHGERMIGNPDSVRSQNISLWHNDTLAVFFDYTYSARQFSKNPSIASASIPADSTLCSPAPQTFRISSAIIEVPAGTVVLVDEDVGWKKR